MDADSRVRTHTQNRRAVLFGLGAVGLWSTVATAFKWSLDYLSPLELVTWASGASWLFLTLRLTLTHNWSTLRLATPAQVTQGMVTGLLNPALYYLVLFAAYDRLPAQEAMAINYSWALTLPLLAAPLMGQRLRSRELVAASVSYVGVIVIATQGALTTLRFENPTGVLLALLSTIIWSLYWIANTRSKLHPELGLFLNFTGGLVVLVPLMLIWHDTGATAVSGLLGAAYVGMFEMGLSFVLWLTAMRLTSHTAKISTLIFLSPPVSLILIWFVLGEPIRASTLAGLCLILIGLVLQHRGQSEASEAPA